MTEQKEPFEQQILFNDDSVKESSLSQESEQPVVLDNLDYQIAEEPVSEVVEEQSQTKFGLLSRAFIALFTLLVIIETVSFLQSSFSQSPFVGALYAALISMLGVIVGTRLIKEFTGLKQLKHQQAHRQTASDILTQTSDFSADKLCQEVHSNLAFDITQQQEETWQQAREQGLTDQELIKLYDIEILSSVDDKALKEIAKYSSEAMALVALSPLALLDMLIMVWRNFKLIDKVAGLYGIRLGYWSRIKLIKQVFTNMVLVGASEVLIDLGSDALGADILGKFSGRLGQGFGAGMLTARLGVNTIQVCRPLPFTQKKIRLLDVRKGLIVQIKNLLKNKVSE